MGVMGRIVLLGLLGLGACGGRATATSAPPAPTRAAGWPSPVALLPGAVAPTDRTTCPADHAIKGYRDKGGQLLYRTPTGRDYRKITPEACFASERDAEQAGYRHARD